MAEEKDQPVPGPAKINAADNPVDWLIDKAGKQATADQASTPAEPNTEVPQAAQPVNSWREVVYGDDAPEFLRGKKVADGVTSWEHAQRSLTEANQRAAESRREAEQLRREREAEQAARRIKAEELAQQQLPREQQGDARLVEANRLWFEDPPRALALVNEYHAEQARKIAAEETAKYRDETNRDKLVTQGEQAFLTARLALNIPEDVWQKRGKAVLVEVTDRNSMYFNNGGPFNAGNLVHAYKELFGEPVTAAPIPITAPPPQLSNPPGSKKPVAAAAPGPSSRASSEENRKLAEIVAQYGGVSAEGLLKRMDRE